jgi:hypothetical protein
MRCSHCNGTGREPGAPTAPAPPPPTDLGWAGFWQRYPRKTAKAAAERAYCRLKPPPALWVAIMKALDAQIGAYDWTHDRKGTYFPHAATWLHGRRWEDVVHEHAENTWNGIQVGDPSKEAAELAALGVALRPKRKEEA